MRTTPGLNALIIAIGDLHGHYPALERILGSLHEAYGILRPQSDPDRLQRGVTLVLTGDYIDRGRTALRIIERLRRLDERNPGQVVTLMGNHELMALGTRDVAVDLLERGGDRSPRSVMAAYRARTNHGGNGGTEFIREFGDGSLPALRSYVDRMARTGDIGAWMRALEPAYQARIAGRTILFMHADLPEELHDKKRLQSRLRKLDRRRKVPTEDVGGAEAKWGASPQALVLSERAIVGFDADGHETVFVSFSDKGRSVSPRPGAS